jgi:hypothetical protein
MRKLLFILFSCCALWSSAQITITQNDMPEPGDTLRYSIASAVGVDIVQTGANQSWDYTGLVPLRQDRDDYVYSLVTPYAFYFLGINQYGTKVADTIGGGPFVFTQVYNFFRSASNDFRAEGVGFRYSGLPLAAYYSDEDELFQFPLNYGDRDTNTFRFSVDLGNGLRFSEEGTRYNNVDGWGTVITPFGSFPCIRMVSNTIAVDTIVFNNFPFATPNDQRTIKFLTNGIHIPVLEITGRVQQGQFVPQQVKYRDNYQNLVATELPAPTEIAIYPNPVADWIAIENTTTQVLEATLLDPQGKLLLQQALPLGTSQLDVHALPMGIYLLEMHDTAGNFIKSAKVLVKH